MPSKTCVFTAFQVPRVYGFSPLNFHRSIPAFNRELEAIQRNLENIAFLLRIPQRKPWGNMASDVAVSLAAFDNQQQLLAGVPQQELPAAEQLLSDLYAKLKQLELAVKTQQPDFAGVRVADALKGVADLELLEVCAAGRAATSVDAAAEYWYVRQRLC
eukprot:GHRR01022672.1.p1 GENE.GHRR01022672.1~~GHRR01022672.1.p1  ORF type:complete len:159 (+),score=57.03 GHRR01022672.1:879-1355(+)